MLRRAFGNQRGEVLPGATLRTDAWWLLPAVVVLVLRAFILSLQTLHRYAWYFAVIFIVLLTWDAILAFRFPDGIHMGVGTVIMWINVLFLAGYTFSCHSCRHLCGGSVDVFSKAPACYGLWRFITRLNERHPLFAWLSLFSVGLTDVYVRLLSMGVIRDVRIF